MSSNRQDLHSQVDSERILQESIGSSRSTADRISNSEQDPWHDFPDEHNTQPTLEATQVISYQGPSSHGMSQSRSAYQFQSSTNTTNAQYPMPSGQPHMLNRANRWTPPGSTVTQQSTSRDMPFFTPFSDLNPVPDIGFSSEPPVVVSRGSVSQLPSHHVGPQHRHTYSDVHHYPPPYPLQPGLPEQMMLSPYFVPPYRQAPAVNRAIVSRNFSRYSVSLSMPPYTYPPSPVYPNSQFQFPPQEHDSHPQTPDILQYHHHSLSSQQSQSPEQMMSSPFLSLNQGVSSTVHSALNDNMSVQHFESLQMSPCTPQHSTATTGESVLSLCSSRSIQAHPVIINVVDNSIAPQSASTRDNLAVSQPPYLTPSFIPHKTMASLPVSQAIINVVDNSIAPQSASGRDNLAVSQPLYLTPCFIPHKTMASLPVSQAAEQAPLPKRMCLDNPQQVLHSTPTIPDTSKHNIVSQQVLHHTNFSTNTKSVSSSLDSHQITEVHVRGEEMNIAKSQTTLAPDSGSSVSILSTEQNVQLRESSLSQLECLPTISEQNFNLVYNTLYSVRAKWYEFGLALELLTDTLNSIGYDEHYKTDRCLREVLCKRIEMKQLTWEEVVDALRRPAVSRNDLAEKIEKGDVNFSTKTGVDYDLSGEPTLEELCALPVEKVWYQLGVWLGVEDIILSVTKGSRPYDKVKWIFSAFLKLPIGTKPYQELVKELSNELRSTAESLLEQSKLIDFMQLFPSIKQTEAEELAKKTKKPKYPTLITALVNVGQREIAEAVCSRKGA